MYMELATYQFIGNLFKFLKLEPWIVVKISEEFWSYAKFRPEKLKNKDQNEVGGADGD